MSIDVFLSDLESAGVSITADGARLVVDAPAGILGADLRRKITGHKPELMKILAKNAINPPELDLCKRLSSQNRWRFLTHLPFTWRMLEIAAARWRAPLNIWDLKDIEQGSIYLFEAKELALREYLARWACDNPEMLRQLITAVFDGDPPSGNPRMVRVYKDQNYLDTQIELNPDQAGGLD